MGKELEAKKISLIVKIGAALLLVLFYILYCVGVFSTNVDDIIKVAMTIVALFVDVSINTAIDKFTGKTTENKNLNEEA